MSSDPSFGNENSRREHYECQALEQGRMAAPGRFEKFANVRFPELPDWNSSEARQHQRWTGLLQQQAMNCGN